MAEVIIIDYNEHVIIGNIYARMAGVTIGNVIKAVVIINNNYQCNNRKY